MRIGLDISSVVYGRGVSRYTANLARALQKHTELEVSLYGSSFRLRKELRGQAKALSIKESTRAHIQPLPPSLLELLWRFNLNKISKVAPDINLFHSWDWIQPRDSSVPLVSTVHDLAMLHFPETAHPKILSMHERSWNELKKRQAHVIAVSSATKKDLIELLGYPSHLIHVVHEALPEEIVSVSTGLTEESYGAIRDRLQLPNKFVLFVGTREPRKNLDRLIKACKQLGNDIELLVVGARGWDESEQQALPKNIRLLGRVSDEELSVLYGEASVFAYPSVYEGFGLPILEAFFHGTPVVTSESSGMLEVAGNAAELVNPKSIESIAEGIKKVLNESIPQQQKRLQRMMIRLQMFNWQKVAKETEAVYTRALHDWES